jgi:hypothetical protein
MPDQPAPEATPPVTGTPAPAPAPAAGAPAGPAPLPQRKPRPVAKDPRTATVRVTMFPDPIRVQPGELPSLRAQGLLVADSPTPPEETS